jgi:hypothetical protein
MALLGLHHIIIIWHLSHMISTHLYYKHVRNKCILIFQLFFLKKYEHLKPTYLSKYLNMMKEIIIQKKIDQIMTIKVKFWTSLIIWVFHEYVVRVTTFSPCVSLNKLNAWENEQVTNVKDL